MSAVHTYICRHCKVTTQVEGREPFRKVCERGWRPTDLLQTGRYHNGQTSMECPECQAKPQAAPAS